MMEGTKYIKLFDTQTNYNAYINGSEVYLPNVSLTLDNDVVHYNPAKDYSKEYFTLSALESGTITWNPTGSTDYSLNDGAWNTWNGTLSVSSGDKVKFKRNNSASYSATPITSTANFEAEGNIMSLSYGDNYENANTLTNAKEYWGLFSGCTKIISAENLKLPAETLTDSCYGYMFYGCSSLTTAPTLESTSLASSCYNNMFRGCSSLVNVQNRLPAQEMQFMCYGGMFSDCSSLATAPELPATTLATSCYNGMFRNCTSLTTAPELPALTLQKYCYQQTFNGCTQLNYIKAMFTSPVLSSKNYSDYTTSWVSGVASSGTFVKNVNATWTYRGVNGIPTNWTVETA